MEINTYANKTSSKSELVILGDKFHRNGIKNRKIITIDANKGVIVSKIIDSSKVDDFIQNYINKTKGEIKNGITL